MIPGRRLGILALVAFLAAGSARADEEASNIPYVAAGQWGRCYAKAVPDSYYEEGGTTRVWRVEAGQDVLLDSYDWYSQRVYLRCNLMRNGEMGASLVRMGRWARGHEANAGDLAIAFYFGGEMLAAYSTLNIAGTPDNVEHSVSHYVVFRDVPGYRSRGSAPAGRDLHAFDVTTIDGRRLSFDPVTGEIIPPE